MQTDPGDQIPLHYGFYSIKELKIEISSYEDQEIQKTRREVLKPASQIQRNKTTAEANSFCLLTHLLIEVMKPLSTIACEAQA